MITRRLHVSLLLALLCAVPLLLAYRFTFDNPSIGKRNAPFTLEYFSTSECPTCLQFESVDLKHLNSMVVAGNLRLIFRDLPGSAEKQDHDRRLFCLQEHEDYVALRRTVKVEHSFDWTSLPPLAGRARSRYEECLSTPASDAILSHNKRDFEDRGFVATPSFTLVMTSGRETSLTSWSGRPSVPALLEALTAYRSRSAGTLK